MDAVTLGAIADCDSMPTDDEVKSLLRRICRATGAKHVMMSHVADSEFYNVSLTGGLPHGTFVSEGSLSAAAVRLDSEQTLAGM